MSFFAQDWQPPPLGPSDGLPTAEDPTAAAVLVVDDERGPRESLRMILSGSHRVHIAEDGRRALEILRSETIDLVTVDLNMPGMKGDELMRTIRQEFPDIEVIVITGCGSVETAVEGIRHGVFDYLTKPFDVTEVLASVERALERRRGRRQMVDFLESLGPVLGAQRDPATVLEELESSPVAQQRLRQLLEEPWLDTAAGRAGESEVRSIEFLEVLAETVESRDVTMRGHARRVAYYADLVAERLMLRRDDREGVRLSAFLHDLGKIGADMAVLEGRPLDEGDRAEAIEAHAAVGERLLRPLTLPTEIERAVRHHHERFDGRGYPDRLSGAGIPLFARIIAIADAYDAMTCDTPYRGARSRADALSELRREAGHQFDPDLAEIFCELVEAGATDALAETRLPVSASRALRGRG